MLLTGPLLNVGVGPAGRLWLSTLNFFPKPDMGCPGSKQTLPHYLMTSSLGRTPCMGVYRISFRHICQSPKSSRVGTLQCIPLASPFTVTETCASHGYPNQPAGIEGHLCVYQGCRSTDSRDSGYSHRYITAREEPSCSENNQTVPGFHPSPHFSSSGT